MKDGVNTNLRELSSAVIRIAREQQGIAEALAPQLFRDGRLSQHPAAVAARRRQDHAAAGPGAVPLRRGGGACRRCGCP